MTPPPGPLDALENMQRWLQQQVDPDDDKAEFWSLFPVLRRVCSWRTTHAQLSQQQGGSAYRKGLQPNWKISFHVSH